MKLTFFNVGQGDSIVAEWQDNEKQKVAIVDCKTHNQNNPVKDYIKENGIKNIEFIILSHPHSDHVCGVRDLLEYCEKNEVSIKYLYHTSTLSPNRIKIATKDVKIANEIADMFLLLKELKKKSYIKICSLTQSGGFEFKLNDEWSLQILSPAFKEMDAYSKNVDYSIIEQDEEPGNEPYANYLSSVLAFYNNVGYFLLTSDAIIDTFYRLDKEYLTFFNSKKLLLGQVPHHGSKLNFKPIFWKNKNKEKRSIPMVISVGKNGYKHPHKDVLSDLRKFGYSIHTTESLSNLTPKALDATFYADMFSSTIPSTRKKITFLFADSAVTAA